MSKRAKITDIIFDVPGADGPIKCELIPLKQRDAGRVFHTCAGQLLSAISGAVGANGQEAQVAAIAGTLGKNDYDLIWDLAESLCKDAIIGGKEVRSLEDIDEIAETPWILYMIIFHGVKGNWPRVFSELGTKLGGFASRIQDQMKTTIGG